MKPVVLRVDLYRKAWVEAPRFAPFDWAAPQVLLPLFLLTSSLWRIDP